MKRKPRELDHEQLSDAACGRCLELYLDGAIRAETVQRLPIGAFAPLASDGGKRKCCYDCASADALMRFQRGLTFVMARVAVGNDRQEQYRLPGADMGLVHAGLVRPSKPGDLERQHAWLEKQDWLQEIEA